MVDTARRAVAELAASQHRTFTRKQAAALNFDHRRIATALAAGWIVEPRPGVLAIYDGTPLTWEQRLSTLILATEGRGAASHRTAARLHGLDGFDKAINATIEITVSSTIRFKPMMPGVVHHVDRLDECDITTVNGFRCVTRERALGELGSVIADSRWVQRALTSARRAGLDLDATRATTQRLHRPGQSGTGTLLRLLDQIPWEGQLPDTWFEELLALCLDDPALPPIELQHRIRDSSGTVVARPDIAFPSIRLGLEAHSRRFHFGPLAEPLDEERDIAAGLCGWELYYLGWHATKRPAEVLDVVRRLIDTRRSTLRHDAA